MTFDTETRVPTEKAKKYATQLSNHWSHKLAVEEVDGVFHVTFRKDSRGADWPGDAIVTLAPESDALVCRIKASAEGQREGLKGAVERHVDRFAFREGALTYDWQDS